jgi:hypothetical protein
MKIAHNGSLVMSANQKDHIDSTIYVVLVKGEHLLLV